MTTELEIIDTAVKVGLGAVISGIATYFLTTRTHRHEIRKSLVNEKKELLRESVMKLERSSSLMNHAVQSINALKWSAVPNKEERLVELIGQITTAYNEGKEARALCELIGQKSLAGLVLQYLDATEELKKHFFERRLGFVDSFVESNADKRLEVRNAILDRLGEALESIYS